MPNKQSSAEGTPFLLRIARGTRHLDSFRGLTILQRIYRKVLPHDTAYRIGDFDGDLLLDVNVRECVGVNLWHAPEQYEREERRRFCSEIRPGTTVLDVGANIGIFTLLAAKRGARVFAIEADPYNARILRRHVELNGFSGQVTVIEMAAVETPGMVQLYRNESNRGGNSLYGEGVPIGVAGKTVDSLDLPPIDVCKIDIEGAEIPALRGMTETLRRSPNMKMLVECSDAFGKDRATELLRLVKQAFSRISIVEGGMASAETLPSYCNLWCTDPLREKPAPSAPSALQPQS